jgi:hypothetical protein
LKHSKVKAIKNMHAYEPNSEYKLVPVLLAIPAELSDAEITDGLNDLLNREVSADFIADWQFPERNETYSIGIVGDDPEEGEAFRSSFKPKG